MLFLWVGLWDLGSLFDWIDLAEASFFIHNISRNMVDCWVEGELIKRISANLFFFILNEAMLPIEFIKSRSILISTLMQSSVYFFTDRIDSRVKWVALHFFCFYLSVLIYLLLHLLSEFPTCCFDKSLLSNFPHDLLTYIIYFWLRELFWFRFPKGPFRTIRRPKATFEYFLCSLNSLRMWRRLLIHDVLG